MEPKLLALRDEVVRLVSPLRIMVFSRKQTLDGTLASVELAVIIRGGDSHAAEHRLYMSWKRISHSTWWCTPRRSGNSGSGIRSALLPASGTRGLCCMRPSKHSEDSRLYYDWLEMAARDLLAARLLIEQGQCLKSPASTVSNAWKRLSKHI